MQVRVLLFAAYRELVGQKSLQVDVVPDATVDDVFEAVQRVAPDLARLRPYTSFAVNREIEPAGFRVKDGDEIAFIQPVSGGVV
jgi:molybdopterin converting factor small subunit